MATTLTPIDITTSTDAFLAEPPVRPPTARPAISLERRFDGRLWLSQDGTETPVHVVRCFPWSEPNRFFSLRDEQDDELAVVATLQELDPDSRIALEDGLAEAGFVFQLISVEQIDEEVELRCWRATTSQGPRLFQTRIDDWPRKLGDGRLLIRDVAGDLYLLPQAASLSAHSQEVLWAFLD
jgi:hypothetical protein